MGVERVPGHNRFICDRCGHETSRPYDRGAKADVTALVDLILPDGSFSGYVRKWWFCGTCIESLLTWVAQGGES